MEPCLKLIRIPLTGGHVAGDVGGVLAEEFPTLLFVGFWQGVEKRILSLKTAHHGEVQLLADRLGEAVEEPVRQGNKIWFLLSFDPMKQPLQNNLSCIADISILSMHCRLSVAI